jgi:hypothetical protein
MQGKETEQGKLCRGERGGEITRRADERNGFDFEETEESALHQQPIDLFSLRDGTGLCLLERDCGQMRNKRGK